MACPLTALANIISTQVDVVNKAYSEKGLDFPDLDDPSQPPPPPGAQDPSLAESKALLVAAADQILATVRPPVQTFTELSFGVYGMATLAFVIDTNIPDILKEAGATGLHVKDIAAKNNVDAGYIARVLRFLATRHIFKEISPDVFVNNHLSSLLIKTKSLEEIKADPIARFDEAPFAAFISRTGDEALQSSVFLSSFLQNPGQHAAPFNLGFKTEAKLWDWYEEPENNWRARRFRTVMKDTAGHLFVKADLIDCISAASLTKDDLIVDVGGSLGKVTHALYQEMPQYRYAVQDLETLIEGGKQFWNQVAPDALASGRVQLNVHNFFNPQPIKGAALYFLRFIIHDWPDKDVKVILKHLRDAADSSSKLIICDSLAVHACESSSVTTATGNEVPYPLLPCLGVAGAGLVSRLDIQMLNLYNGQERTESDFKNVGEASGWKLESVIKNTRWPCFLYSPV